MASNGPISSDIEDKAAAMTAARADLAQKLRAKSLLGLQVLNDVVS